MRNIWLVRHAQSLANQAQIIQGQGILNTKLTKLGLQQAQTTADYFYDQGLKIQHLYASNLKRAQQTAEIIAQKLSLNLQTEEDLKEADFGKWEGCYFAALAIQDPENYNKWIQDKTWRPSWCESFEDLQKRANVVLQKILAQTNQNIIIVSHGGLMAALIASLTDSYGKHPSSHNCGITHLQLINNKLEVLQVNFCAYEPITKI